MRSKIRNGIFIALIAAISLSACSLFEPANPVGGDENESSQTGTSTSNADTTTATTTTEPVVVTEPSVVRFIAAGDNLIHGSLFLQAEKYAKEKGLEGYDPTYQYELIAKYIPLADIAVLNQETPLCGDVYAPSNYPLFSTPTDYGRHMVKLGFDVFNHATNHIIDKGEGGAIATMDFWDTQPDATVVGVYRDEEDMNNIRTVEKNGLTFSFLGFTFSTNGLNLPASSPVEIIYTHEEDKMYDQIKRAREVSDVVVVNVHWGIEGAYEPNYVQVDLAQKFADWGADVILGTHPHVLQPIVTIDAADGRKVLCFYSLGNLISSQNLTGPMAGGLFDFTVSRSYDEDGNPGPIEFSNIAVMPIVTHYEANVANLRIIPFKDYTPELANKHGLLPVWGVPYSYEMSKNIFDTVITDKYLVDELE